MTERRPPDPPPPEGRDLEAPRRPRGPTRREAVRGVEGELAAAGIESPRAEAERLVAHAVGVERSRLGLALDEPMDVREAGRLARAVRRRLSGEPLQHIEGTVAFRELVLLADPRALIPRPETEQLVERIAEWARERARGEAGGGEPPGPADGTGSAGDAGEGVVRIRRPAERPEAEGEPPLERVLDIGTGSGAIALSLVREGIARRAVGLDISAEALRQAAANRALAELDEERVEFRLGARPIWTAVRPEERFDVVVSNPPYVTDEEMERLPPEVRDHEPREALAGGDDGLEVVREIVGKAHLYLRPSGALFLEIGAGQGDAVRKLLMGSGRWRSVEVRRDLAGRHRFVRARPRRGPPP